jgi:hypothetical protein
MKHQPQLWPLLGALKRLRQEGLSAALVLLAIHHRWVLPLMARPLRMDEMCPRATPEHLNVCHMSREALLDEEIVTRVRAIIAGAF